MHLKSLIVATAMLAVPAIAFAQSSPSPNNQSGPSVSPSVQAPTDQGAGNETGNTKATPERSTPGTTGAGSMGSRSMGGKESKGTATGPGTTPTDRDRTGTRAPDNAH